MRLSALLRGLRTARVTVLMAAAAVLALSSFEIDQLRMAEEKGAFFRGNAVIAHSELAWVAILLGAGSMVLSAVAWHYTNRRILVSILITLLIPIAFQLYGVILVVFFLLGYGGPMP
jgi:hypothetical protein